jgi:pheromone a factor receptor
MILLYIPVQSVRYNIWGIEGCISAYRPNWQSLVLNVVWIPITTIVVAYYAGKSLDMHEHHLILTTV